MRRYPGHLVSQARSLASLNIPYSQISRQLRVSPSTVSIWCNDVENNKWKSTLKTHVQRRIDLTNSDIRILDHINTDRIYSKLYCALLYGCEGSKYPATRGLALTNSDPLLILTFVSLLRKSYRLRESKWRVILQIHSDQNIVVLKKYWSNLLKIPVENFYKPTVTSPKGKKHRNEYWGTCTIKYFDYRIQLKLIGIYNEFMRKSSSQGGVA